MAVDGELAMTEPVPTELPSMKKDTVPVGGVAPTAPGVICAVSCKVLPAAGVELAGTTATVGVLLLTLSVTGVAVELP